MLFIFKNKQSDHRKERPSSIRRERSRLSNLLDGNCLARVKVSSNFPSRFPFFPEQRTLCFNVSFTTMFSGSIPYNYSINE